MIPECLVGRPIGVTGIDRSGMGSDDRRDPHPHDTPVDDSGISPDVAPDQGSVSDVPFRLSTTSQTTVSPRGPLVRPWTVCGDDWMGGGEEWQ